MTIRLAILGLGHETNTFSNIPATLELYQDGGIHRGEEIVENYATSQATFAGFLADPQPEVELVPLLTAWVNPCGAVTAEAYTSILDEMLDLLAAEGPFDGVLLGLHGAAVAEGVDDADGDIATKVRGVVGDSVPIAAVIDMHANVSEQFTSQLNLLFPYQSNPHVDARARGREAKEHLLSMIREGHSPQLALTQLPLVVTITKQDTSEEPMASLLRKAKEIEELPGVIDASVIEGFPYADVPQMGMSVTVTHLDNAETARALSAQLANEVWQVREELQGSGTPIAEAITKIAQHTSDSPLLVLDVGDNVGGGAPGDLTSLLQEAMARSVAGVVGTIFDPVAVQELEGVAIGSQVQLFAGARHSADDCEPLHIVGRLIARSDGKYEEPKMAHGGLRFFDAGESVAIETVQGVTIVLCSKLVQPITPHQLGNLGLDPAQFRAIIAKGVNGPRAGFADSTEGLITADTPGVTRLSVQGFSYIKRRQPMYPYEETTTFQPERLERNNA